MGVPDLPLIRRDLLQQSMRRRTYGLRCLVLLVLSFVFLVPFMSLRYMSTMGTFYALGHGRNLVGVILMTLACVLYALTPAMTCGAISSERSRQTLPLLLVSRLSARSIILEKLVAHLVPLMVFLLLAAPLLAVSYLFGGISFPEVGACLLLLALLAVHLVAVSLFWSTVLRGSLAAFWATYATLLGTSFGLGFLRGFGGSISESWLGIMDWLLTPCGLFVAEPGERTMILFPIYHVVAIFGGGAAISDMLWAAVPFNLVSVVFVWLACRALRPEGMGFTGDAESQAGGQRGVLRLLEPLRRRLAGRTSLDRIEPRRGRLSGRQRPASPPSIAWRERRKLLVFRRWFIGATTILLCCYLTFATGQSFWQVEVSAMYVITFEVLALLVIVSLSSRLFVAEKERETLDSLLTCPLSTKEILRQKLAGVNTAMFWLFLVCATLGVCRVMGVPFEASATILDGNYDYSSPWESKGILQKFSWAWWSKSAEYLLLYLGNVLAFMTIVKWVGVWFGLKTGSQMKAMLGSLLSLLGLCFIPMICMVVLMISVRSDPDEMPLFFFSSPLIVETMGQNDALRYIYGNSWFPKLDLAVILVNLTIYGGLAVVIRQLVRRQVPSLLQRRDSEPQPAEQGRHLMQAS